jgi:hypothetical protein
MADNVNIITRGGTNTFHGSLFENHQQDGFDASNPFVETTPDKRFDQFGGSLGGPLVRSRLFFFGAYEGAKFEQGKVIRGTVPTPEFRAQVLPQNHVYAPFMEQFPEPTMASEPGAVTSTSTLTREETRSDSNLTLRSDLNISTANRLTGRYTRGRPDRHDPRLTPVNPRVYDGAQDFGTFSFTHAASRWVSETRAGLSRSVIDRVDQLYVTGMPNISAEGLSLADGEFFQKRGWLFSLDQVVAMTHGRHSLKAGFNMQHQRAGRSNFQTPGYSYSSPPDFLANIPSSVQFTFGLDDFQIRASQFGGFIQDDTRADCHSERRGHQAGHAWLERGPRPGLVQPRSRLGSQLQIWNVQAAGARRSVQRAEHAELGQSEHQHQQRKLRSDHVRLHQDDASRRAVLFLRAYDTDRHVLRVTSEAAPQTAE